VHSLMASSIGCLIGAHNIYKDLHETLVVVGMFQELTAL